MRWLAPGITLLAFALFQAVFTGGFYPGANGSLGYDYGYYFPRMVTAELALRAGGWLSVPWFSPAFCAGGFQAANPIDVTYSLPQLVSLLFEPLTAARVTHVLMAVVGAAGTWGLARHALRLGLLPALLAALAFGCNEFFAARMVTGHLNFHTWMLLPWIAWALLTARDTLHWPTWLGGVLLAVCFWGGGAHVLPPMGISLVIIVLLRRLWQPDARSAWQDTGVVTVAALLGTLLSLPKLGMGFALVAHLPRPDYGLAGLESLGAALAFGPLAVFTAVLDAGTSLAGSRLRFDAVEFEYGLTPVLVPVLAAGLFVSLRRWLPRRTWRVEWLLLGLLWLLPVVLGWHLPALHAVLDRLPVLGDSAILLRWYCAWLLPLALLAAMALQMLPRRVALPLGVLACISAPVWFALQDWQRLRPGTFDFPTLLTGLESARAGADVRVVSLDATLNADGSTARASASRDVGVASGVSQVFCYESLFGYFHENLVTGDLRLAPALAQINGGLNFKNPACYVFPEDNQCAPGDRFRVSDRASLERFLAFEPLAFERPWWQRVAGWLTPAAWLLVVGVLLAQVLRRLIAGTRKKGT